MIPNLRPDTVYAVHLRAQSVSGGKDWVGSVTANNEIHTYWGRTGKIVQHAGKPGDMTGLLKIIDQKQNGKDRYTLVDEFTQQEGWHSQGKQTSQPSHHTEQQPAVTPAVDWVDAPRTSIKWDF